jgi:hypothetical protein
MNNFLSKAAFAWAGAFVGMIIIGLAYDVFPNSLKGLSEYIFTPTPYLIAGLLGFLFSRFERLSKIAARSIFTFGALFMLILGQLATYLAY